MKIYEIIIEEGQMSYDQSHYIMAESFEDAYKQALKILSRSQKTCDDAYISAISEQFKLEVVK
jgi:hypothetical protein